MRRYHPSRFTNYLFLFLRFLTFFECNEGTNQYLCIKDILSTPCNQNFDLSLKLQCSGTEIFQTSSSPSISKFAIAGWFIMKGGLSQEYNIMSVYENNNDLLFTVQYNWSQKKIKSQLLQNTFSILDYSNGSTYTLKKIWHFARFKMEVLLGQGVNLDIKIYESSQTNYFYLTKTINQRSANLFQTSGLIFDYGKGNSQFSCILFRLMYIYWDSDLLDSSIFSLFNDLSTYDINLKWNYNTYYTRQNPGYLIQTNEPNGKLQIPMSRAEHFVLKDQEQFSTDFINLSSNGGFVLTFNFKLEPQNIQANKFIVAKINNVILMVQNGQLYFNNNQISGAQLNQWNQVTIVYRQLIYNQITFILNDDESTYQYLPLIDQIYQFVQVIFGDPSNTNYLLKLNYIRVYEGIFLSSNPSCFMLAARQNKSCIICRKPYLLDFQNGMTCVSPSVSNQSTQVDNVRDWYPKQLECPQNMILNSQNVCVCMLNFYRVGNECIKCKDYCLGCLDENTCIQKDSNRDANGNCLGNNFDDSYKCIPYQFILKKKTNILQSLPDLEYNCNQGEIDSRYEIHNDLLKIKRENIGFFFSFTFSKINSQAFGTIAVLKDGTNQLFTITYDNIQHNGMTLPAIKFYILGILDKTFVLSNSNSVWIGLWNNFITAKFFIYTDLLLYSSQTDVSVQFQSITQPSPTLCVGKCTSLVSANHVCGEFSKILFLIQFSFNDNDKIYQLSYPTTNQIAFFQVDFFNLPKSTQIIDPTAQKILQISNPNYRVNRMKGILFTQDITAQILNLNFASTIPTFSCHFFVEKLKKQQLLVSFQMTLTSFVEYYLVPYGNTKAFIRICQQNICLDTSYAMINLNEQNFLYIIWRYKGQVDTSMFQEFEIFLNYQREVLEGIIEKYSYLNLSNIYFFQQDTSSSNQDFAIYLSKIRIEPGNRSYYTDYNKSENCFIFKNVYSMSCQIPKKGTIYYKNGSLISDESCKELTTYYKSFHIVNPSTQTCVDTKLSPYCQDIDETSEVLVCSKCLYPGQILIKNCECEDGYFFNNENLACEECHPKCQTCTENYDNCSSCKYEDQSPPSCDCNQFNYFLNSNYQCQLCSYKCESCQLDSQKCQICAKNRINPPTCECKENFIEINNECKDNKCDSKCLTCDSILSNCITCNKGRVNPPQCDCKPNFFENLDGTCSICNFGSYYNQISQSCNKCSIECLICIDQPSNCLACRKGLFQLDSKCKCQKGTSLAYIRDEYLCIENMEVQIIVNLYKNEYILTFQFDESIMQLDYSYMQNISSLIKVTLSEIPESTFTLSNPIIKDNTLSIKLNVLESFKTKQGWVLFLDNTQFLSVSKKHVLNKSYTEKLVGFKIGPFIFKKDILQVKQLDQIKDFYKNSNSAIFSIFNKFQIILYILNSAQPTVLFLLINAQLPPNLYKFYQVVGLIIYPDVVDYQTNNYQEKFKLFGLSLNQSEIYSSSQITYKKVGFSNSFFINSQLIVIKYLVIAIALFTVQILMARKINLLNFKFQNKYQKISQTLKKLINSENDTNLLILSQSILVQFTFFDQETWGVRYGYYLAIVFSLTFLISLYRNVKEINTKQSINEEDYSFQYIERIQDKTNKYKRNYFIFQLIKKYLLLLIIFIFQNFPIIVCSINGLVLLLSCLSTLILNPYKNTLSRIIKISGEFLVSLSWFLHIPILFIEKKLIYQTLIDDGDKLITNYLNLGLMIIITLIIFNGIFFIEKLFSIYLFIKQIQANKAQNKLDKLSEVSNSLMDSQDKKDFSYQTIKCKQQQYEEQKNKLN